MVETLFTRWLELQRDQSWETRIGKHQSIGWELSYMSRRIVQEMPKNAKEGTLGAEAENAGKETEKDTK